MPVKERKAFPSVGDQVRLRLYTYNSNAPKSVFSIEKIDVYHIDTDNTESFVESIDGSLAVQESEGVAYVDVSLTSPQYVIGSYKEVWSVKLESADSAVTKISNFWAVHEPLWYSSSDALVLDYKFGMRPNKIRKGSIQHLRLQVQPNAPDASSIEQYYKLVQYFGDMKIKIINDCGDCETPEDLKVIVEDVTLTEKDGNVFFYKLDTTDLDAGLYHVTLTLDVAGNRYLSDKMALQIYD